MSAPLSSKPGDCVLRTHHHESVLVVNVSGEVDLATINPIANELIGLVTRRPHAVVVDLQTVTFLGSIGITLLLDAQEYAEQQGVPFATTAANRAVLRPLRLAGADRVLRPHATLPDAVSTVRAQIG
ncbi:STAS domain-containing protein [Lentzea sp. NEAU-D13]|uniref:Anti-sigma factor antagonist n=1 Tax=Lentzea alba TaxID=2714351 RepID=A0A7C9W6Q0_9PSEU|nr:STAS domain-containing protein [Lentzea alba]NGY66481.1 STAS domain-containing protein [Lentzea alba]